MAFWQEDGGGPKYEETNSDTETECNFKFLTDCIQILQHCRSMKVESVGALLSFCIGLDVGQMAGLKCGHRKSASPVTYAFFDLLQFPRVFSTLELYPVPLTTAQNFRSLLLWMIPCHRMARPPACE